MTVARIAQTESRTVSDGSPKARVAQTESRVVSDSSAKAWVAHTEMRVVSTTTVYIPPSFSVPVINICM